MLDFLRRLHDTYGGAASWLGHHGVEAERLERFRAAMLA